MNNIVVINTGTKGNGIAHFFPKIVLENMHSEHEDYKYAPSTLLLKIVDLAWLRVEPDIGFP
jgi:hypothetical protein